MKLELYTVPKQSGYPVWSGKRGSNPRPLPWQGSALATELFPQILFKRTIHILHLMYKKVNTHKLVYNKNMNIRPNIKFVIPLIVLTVIFGSLFVNPLSNIENQNNNKQSKIGNPTPENIQVLGTQDSKSKTQDDINFDKQVLYNLINSYRKDNNLNKLFVNKLLEDSAGRKLKDMIDKNYFRHADSNNNESWYLFNAAGYNYKFAGENLSSGHNTPWQVFTAWQRSDVHNEQLLKQEYLDMGIAVDCEVYKIKYQPACIVVLHLGSR